MILGSKPRNSEFVHWNSVLVSVIPAEAEIQAILEPESKTNLDAGSRRHDKLSLSSSRGFSTIVRRRLE